MYGQKKTSWNDLMSYNVLRLDKMNQWIIAIWSVDSIICWFNALQK